MAGIEIFRTIRKSEFEASKVGVAKEIASVAKFFHEAAWKKRIRPLVRIDHVDATDQLMCVRPGPLGRALTRTSHF